MALKELILTVSSLGGCGVLERTNLYQFLHLDGVVVLKELILTVSALGKGVVVLKELIVNSFYFGWVWQS